MKDEGKTKEQLVNELVDLRRRLAELETSGTERQRAEEALRDTNELLEKVFATTHLLIAYMDTDFDFIRVNRTYAEADGREPEFFAGKNHFDLYPHKENEVIFRRVAETGEPYSVRAKPFEYAEHPERGVTYWDWDLRPVKDDSGKVEGLVLCLVNVTERVKAEEELRKHRDRLEELVEERTAELQREIAERQRMEEALRRHNRALILLNRAGQELTATLERQQVAERLLQEVTEIVGAEGASVWLWDEEQEGCLVCQAAFRHDQDRSPVNLRLRPGQGIAGWVAQTGESAVVPYTPDDPRFFAGIDGRIGFCTISLLSVPLWASGQVIGVLEVVNKLNGDFDTDDRALVETLAASAAIAIQNARLVEALRQHAAELQERNEELDAFTHTVAHDLKTPLGHVVGFAQVLEKDYATLPEEELRRYLHTMVQSGRKMNNIIDELLLLASVRQMEEVELGPLDMAGIVAEAQRRLTYLIEEHQAEIILPESWPVALGYGPWVEEVWANYLSNAIQYGGRPPRVELGATVQADGRVCFWVRDNGPGLTPEEQARLFTPFTRLDQVRAKGHGLGLSIVQRIVKKLDGQVGVESQVGQGSVFTFTLPGMRQ